MEYTMFLDWTKKLLIGFSDLGAWLTEPIQVGNITTSPLVLVSVSGLIAFIGVAIILWVINL